ncbi:hypothetical protein PACTADRAFT_48707 [Pachysolen tannophilus NRRL Y-2460]|uniref:Uncharacterized protein n=1 Tax=Pachysolen tannophilus NRRL Y-2460 TaxID=669874 RepID=A0A1E4TYV8_PACTA|nr:hypothetical protein PACTADRAFT_48707 [Pachysolen tannophilus NRRL Y-2460]
MVLEEISANLINVAEQILQDSEKYGNNKLQYTKNGRVYRLINHEGFERIKEDHKFLIITRDYNFKENLSLISSYYILKKIDENSKSEGDDDDLFAKHRDLCLSIVGAAREIELNRWYDPNTCVTTKDEASYDPEGMVEEALKFSKDITKNHINNGLLLLCASKINFFHTDHTASKKIEGICLRNLVLSLYGEKALNSEKIYNAIRCFAHWGSIRGILYKLELKSLYVDSDLQNNFRNFPNPPEYLKQQLYIRYPAGTSKYSLAKKAIEMISNSLYGKLIPIQTDMKWLFQLCNDIEKEPARYHLRSSTKNLSKNPVILSKLEKPDQILKICACIINGSNGFIGKKLMTSSKLPKRQTIKNDNIYIKSKNLTSHISKYYAQGLDDDKILEIMGGKVNNCIYDKVKAATQSIL